jgi:hypothetical protein
MQGEEAFMKRVPTVEDVRDIPQLAQMTIPVPVWEYSDGETIEVTLRARTFRERRHCLMMALEAGKNGKPDEDTWAVETVLAGMVEPKFTRDQIGILWDSNAAAIDLIAETIVRLEDVPARRLSREIIRQSDAPASVVAPEE